MKRRKVNYMKVFLTVLVIAALAGGIIYFLNGGNKNNKEQKEETLTMLDFTNKKLSELNFYADQYSLKLELSYEYSDTIEKDIVISQGTAKGIIFKKGDTLSAVISNGKIDKTKLKADGINEMGKVAIMMYHGIENKKSSETANIGGNVDKDGYNRTSEAFREDLEFYYKEGYRMIRLVDYVNGNITTEYGKSPLVLTFDDGNDNNIKVTGLDSDGNIKIDPNSAVGIMEEFKKKYTDFNITATFFLNDGLFNQPEYNEKIMKWLVANGYDIGNHTKGHTNLKGASYDKVQEAIGYVYEQLERIIPNKYVKIIALPFGEPTNRDHANYKYILDGNYNSKAYHTEAALRVGWEPEVSPYNKDFNPTFIKRCRAYDANGASGTFDIESVFKMLKTSKYVSDGNSDTITIPSSVETKLITTTKKVITY